MLNLLQVSYLHPNKDILFQDINLTVNHHDKIALVGNNGSGKSTLLRLIAQELQTTKGHVITNSKPYYIPQVFGQFNDITIAEALRIDIRLKALHEILNGNTSDENFHALNDDWIIEERSKEALLHWQLTDLDLNQKMGSLSGGQKTKVFLAGISIHQPEFILLDEPSNHLDSAGRRLLYDFIQSTETTLIVVSHDRKLLNLLDTVCELNATGITVYGGNFQFYKDQKETQAKALSQDIQGKQRALRKAKEKERDTIEKQQKRDSRGKGKKQQSGVARIMMNTLRNNAENSTSKLKNAHAEKVDGIGQELRELRAALPEIASMNFGFNSSELHRGKVLVSARGINYGYSSNLLWKEGLNFEILSGDRMVLTGNNGSGKTTLVKLILGSLAPKVGIVFQSEFRAVYIDQDYSLINSGLSVYEQAQAYNLSQLEEHEIKIRLNRFLFGKEEWDKLCHSLSGGERMRLMLCCLMIHSNAPDIIVLDEPTNNLDIQNIEILTQAINAYKGTLVVISHDEAFLEEVRIDRTLSL